MQMYPNSSTFLLILPFCFALSYHFIATEKKLFTHSACKLLFSSNCSTYFLAEVRNEISTIISFSSAFYLSSFCMLICSTHMTQKIPLVCLLFAQLFLWLFPQGGNFCDFNFHSSFNIHPHTPCWMLSQHFSAFEFFTKVFLSRCKCATYGWELKAFITTGYHKIHNEQLFRHLLDNFLRKTFAIFRKLLLPCWNGKKGGREGKVSLDKLEPEK